jgi:hypothetical protein
LLTFGAIHPYGADFGSDAKPFPYADQGGVPVLIRRARRIPGCYPPGKTLAASSRQPMPAVRESLPPHKRRLKPVSCASAYLHRLHGRKRRDGRGPGSPPTALFSKGRFSLACKENRYFVPEPLCSGCLAFSQFLSNLYPDGAWGALLDLEPS